MGGDDFGVANDFHHLAFVELDGGFAAGGAHFRAFGVDENGDVA